MTASFTQRLTVSCAILLAAFNGHANELVIGPVKGVKQLSVYDKPLNETIPVLTDVAVFPFPMVVTDKNRDFLQVRLGKRAVWLNAEEVNLDQPVSFDCHRHESQPRAVGSTKGALGGCK